MNNYPFVVNEEASIKELLSNTPEINDHVHEILVLAKLLDYHIKYYDNQNSTLCRISIEHSNKIDKFNIIFVKDDSKISQTTFNFFSHKINTAQLSVIQKLNIIKELL